ncbi:S-adenosylmethionine:tRNA ribosyltransferase-isomerase [Paenibacillus alkalitolerans]|uniref:S-adenosylmethionine:tRNA ribosyltransferase-isomerase n=1 Tax=Paenibacillus alkalitolerans TaxID=2799335 RepID=UPI001F1AAC4D|nr:S-adenosylmethionine:tRNA ribosyltransferase-isomerase [Paenibacillus alkalitolerans]
MMPQTGYQASTGGAGFAFHLPPELNATVPPERRGIRRDRVRLMVLGRDTGRTIHTRFHQLPQFLNAGDLLVLNSSRTVPAVLKAVVHRRSSDTTVDSATEVRLARKLDDRTWDAVIADGSAVPGDRLLITDALTAAIEQCDTHPFVRLKFSLSGAALYNEIYAAGEPIRYEYITTPWPLDYYQTVFASEPGSVEMPSAGRAITWELLFKLRNMGVTVSYVQLHTGLSYLLDDGIPHSPKDHAEMYVIPEETAQAIRRTKEQGGKVVAVGTTVVRTLETAANEDGAVSPGEGWTNLYITNNHKLRTVDGLITGFHEPEASHLEMLSAFVPEDRLRSAYHEAVRQGYLWHEFGDMNLIL